MLIFLDPSPKYSGDLPVFSLIPDLKHDIFELFLTVKSTLEYACEVWDVCFEREVTKLEKVQL
jgi:hypothetical protein